jgi:hypothetical protein
VWFDDECLFLHKRKEAKMLWLQDPPQSFAVNQNNVRREANRHFRNKTTEYLKAKIHELVTNSKTKNIINLYWIISDFKKG